MQTTHPSRLRRATLPYTGRAFYTQPFCYYIIDMLTYAAKIFVYLIVCYANNRQAVLSKE